MRTVALALMLLNTMGAAARTAGLARARLAPRVPALVRQHARALAAGQRGRGGRGGRGGADDEDDGAGAFGGLGGLRDAKISFDFDPAAPELSEAKWARDEPPALAREPREPRVQTAEYSFYDEDEDDVDVADGARGGAADRARGAAAPARAAAPRQPRGGPRVSDFGEPPPRESGARLDIQLGRCAGCGIALQSTAGAAVAGFCPPEHLTQAGHVGHRVICARCHGLRHQNSAAREVRVGHSAAAALAPARFDALLAACLRGDDARAPSGAEAPSSAGCGVVVYLVDLFDLEGSVLPGLPALVRPGTPLILVGTKADALPRGLTPARVSAWLRAAARDRILGAGLEATEVHLISSLSRRGVSALADSVLGWAARRRQYGDVYVVGAANVGKSTFLNTLLAPGGAAGARRAGAAAGERARVGPKGGVAGGADAAAAAGVALGDAALDADGWAADESAGWAAAEGSGEGAEEDEDEDEDELGGGDSRALAKAEAAAAARAVAPRLLTASHLPGTTLEPVRIRCRDGLSIFDTPGLVLPGQLARRLTPQEVALLLPRAPVKPTQLSLAAGKSLLLGGLVRVDVLATGFAAQLVVSAFVAPALTLHPTSVARAEAVRAQHAGGMLSPPLGDGAARLAALGPLEVSEVHIEGIGFRKAAADIAIGGIGWLAVLGDGALTLRVYAPRGVAVVARAPLVAEIDGTKGNAKFTGTRVVNGGSGAKKKGRR